jgi:cytochrome P450
MPSTFWYIVETLRNPALTKYLTKELSKHCSPASDFFDIATITAMPIIQSMHAEIGRLRMATATMRTNEVPNFKLDDKWMIPKGMSVMIFAHDLALNTDLWAKVRPQTVERPLEDFWAERFLIPDKPTNPERRSTTKEDKIGSGRFSMAGVAALHTTFGGGQHLCPGRYLAKAIQASTLAVLLCEYEIELSDPYDVDLIMPNIRELAYGTVKPRDKIRLRIRKREIKT